MMLKSIAVLAFTLFTSGHILGQNLVKNPSLEIIEGKYPAGWHIIAGSPDIASRRFINADLITRGFYNPYLNSDKNNRLEVIQFGDICLCQGMNHKWSEVTQVELIRPLKRRKQYQVSLYVIKASPDEPPFEEVSVYISRKSLPSAFHPAGYKVAYVPLVSQASPTLSSRSKWMKVKGVYTAQGGERFVMIGNFLGSNQAQLKQTLAMQDEHFDMYYCYDNVSVVPLEEAVTEETIIEPTTPVVEIPEREVPHLITLEDANFACGEYELHENSFATLDRLADYMKKEPDSKIAIIGHTDNIGNKEKNLQLSINRAKAVMNYLLAAGITAERITYKGLGEDHPKESNLTEGGREKNRRVEIELIKK